VEPIGKHQVLERIRAENPWWEPPHQIPRDWAALRPRPYLNAVWPILRRERPNRALVLLGPRRVGKTVLLHHAVRRLLEDGVDPRSIVYTSLDSPVYTDRGLEELVRLSAEASGASLAYVIFDEIQYLRDWERHLKVLVDGQRSIRFVASGSAAAALRRKSMESGAGRFTDFLLPPLTFHEYVTLTDKVDVAFRTLEPAVADDAIRELNELFVDYVNFGGYPEAVFSEAIRANPARFIRQDVVDKVLLRDLPSLYGISDIQELNRLFSLLAWNTGQELSLEALSKGSGVSKNTIRRYIEYLQAAFLVDVLHRVDREARHFRRAATFKVFLTNPSLRAALFAPEPADGDGFGRLAETAVFSQLDPTAKARTYYARWTKGEQGEVDFVTLSIEGEIETALEVKWSDRAAQEPRQLAGLRELRRRNPSLREAVVTTLTQRATRDLEGLRVHFVPTAVYAFIIGSAWAIARGLESRYEGTEEDRGMASLVEAMMGGMPYRKREGSGDQA
jgi:predicted AAA+ superfamily ATPase